MSLQQKPAHLQPLSTYIRLTKPNKRLPPKLKFYKPNGLQHQTNNFKLRTDQVNTNHNSFIQDSRKSNFTFRAFLQIQTCLLILSITSFVAEIHFGEYNELGYEFQANVLLMSQSAITLAILTLLILRYKLDLQLKKEQKIQSLNANILYIDYLPFMLIEMIICSIHPTYFSKNVIVILFEPYDQVNIQHELNDLLALGMLCRVYLILRALIVSTVFSGTRAARLCRVYGCQHNIIFAVKSIMKQIPLRTLAFLFLLMILIYGQGLRISQHNLIKYFPSDFDLSNYSNCFWTIIITMGTVGYGDYFPRTYPGRGIIFLASISGVILTSLLIITLSEYLSMKTSQTKAHLTHERLKLRQELQKAALQTIKQTALLSYNLKTDDPNLKLSYDKIKKQSATVKVAVRKLQTMMDTDNVNEQMNRLFEILEMSLKQIYQNQVEVKELLESLYHQQRNQLRDIKFSFTTQIEQMIKQY